MFNHNIGIIFIPNFSLTLYFSLTLFLCLTSFLLYSLICLRAEIYLFGVNIFIRRRYIIIIIFQANKKSDTKIKSIAFFSFL